MSAIMLLFAVVLGTLANAAYINRHDSALSDAVPNGTTYNSGDGMIIYSRNRRIVVEEVDKNGNSVIKELELPDFDENEELQEDRRRREQQEKEYHSENLIKKDDMYGCDSVRGNQRRKCLRRQKKLLRKRYRNWKELICRIIKDLDGKIKNLGKDSSKEAKTENLNFMSGFSAKNGMRKKE